MTKKEKLALIKERLPKYYKSFSNEELDSIMADLDDPKKLQLFRETGATQILEGGLFSGIGAGVAAAGKLAKAVTTRKSKTATAEGAEQATKKGKLITKKRLFGAAAAATGINILTDIFGSDEEETATQEKLLQEQTDLNTSLQFAQMEATGIDVEALLNTQAGQQIIKNPNFNLQAILGTNAISNIGSTGVYVGGENKVRTEYVTAPKTGFVGLKDWERQFPVSDPKALAAWKKTLVDSGVVDASAGFGELKKQWKEWGQESLNASRAGQKLTPYQLLDIQRGLWGGGGGGPSYQVQLMKEENSKALFKQGIEAFTGRIVDDAQAEEFAKLITKKQLKKPTKTETKTVGGKRVSVTTPGFGEAEAAALIKKQAQEDPLYAEMQTNNVFGSALEKALGVRG